MRKMRFEYGSNRVPSEFTQTNCVLAFGFGFWHSEYYIQIANPSIQILIGCKIQPSSHHLSLRIIIIVIIVTTAYLAISELLDFYFSSAWDMKSAWEEKWMIRNSHLSSFLFEKLKEMELGKNETAFCDQLIRIFSGSQRNMNEIKMPYIIVLSKGVGDVSSLITAIHCTLERKHSCHNKVFYHPLISLTRKFTKAQPCQL